jgi:hypothetical protein
MAFIACSPLVRSITTEILISLVEIISMFTPSLARVFEHSGICAAAQRSPEEFETAEGNIRGARYWEMGSFAVVYGADCGLDKNGHPQAHFKFLQ